MSDYPNKQLVGVIARIAFLIIALDFAIGPVLGLELSFVEWAMIVTAVSVATVQLGYDFGDGQTRATLVTTELYARDDDLGGRSHGE